MKRNEDTRTTLVERRGKSCTLNYKIHVQQPSKASDSQASERSLCEVNRRMRRPEYMISQLVEGGTIAVRQLIDITSESPPPLGFAHVANDR